MTSVGKQATGGLLFKKVTKQFKARNPYLRAVFKMLRIVITMTLCTYVMMTSSNGNIFRFTGPLCGEFTGHRWIPLTKASDAELCFLWSGPEQTVVQKKIQNAFPWMEMCVFGFQFHCSMSLMVRLYVVFDSHNGLASNKRQQCVWVIAM